MQASTTFTGTSVKDGELFHVTDRTYALSNRADPRLKRDVAIKVSAAQFSERFEHEAKAIVALHYSNIAAMSGRISWPRVQLDYH
jgi:hypothetical protein